MEAKPDPLAEDNLLTAARRVVRFVRVDDQAHGGLLSQDTIQANEHLAKHVMLTEKAVKNQAKGETA